MLPSARPCDQRLACWPLLAIVCCWSLGCGGGRAGVGETSLLLVTLDTVRADRLGCYGYSEAETPSLDRLASRGVRFTQAMAPAPLTLPSHASVLTGLNPPRHGVRNNGVDALPAGVRSLAQHLSDHGYRTGAFVGAFVLDRRFGLSRGFGTYDDAIERRGRWVGLEAERSASEVVDRALEWLGSPEAGPFFLWVHLYDAHAPYSPPEPFRSRHPGRPYDGEIAFVDSELGRLLAELEARGHRRSILVAAAGDHGEGLEEHGERSHGLLLYESTLRVPLILAGPGLPRGGTFERPVSLVDLAPTLSSLLDEPLASDRSGLSLDGRDLAAAIREGTRAPALPAADLYAESHYPVLFGWSALAALRRRGAKYVAGPQPELFDLTVDPGERTNLLYEANRDSGLAERLEARLAELLSRPAVVAESPDLDAEARARLASLGYVSRSGPRRGRGEHGNGAADPPEAPDPRTRLGLFRRYEEATWALADGRVAESLAELGDLVEEDPGNPVFLAQLAQAGRRAGDPELAIRAYRRILELDPRSAETWYHLAVSLQEAGRYLGSVKALERSLEIEPERPEAQNVLGVGLASLGRLEEARGAFARAVELDPRNPRAWSNLGHTMRDLERGAEAAAAYRQALELDPELADPHNGLGTLAVRLGRAEEALGHFERALALNSHQLEPLLNRGIALEVLGRGAAAAAAYRDFLERAGEDTAYAAQRQVAEGLLRRLQATSESLE